MQERQQQSEDIASRLDDEAPAGGQSGTEIFPQMYLRRLARSPILAGISNRGSDVFLKHLRVVATHFCGVCVAICGVCEGCQRCFLLLEKGVGKPTEVPRDCLKSARHLGLRRRPTRTPKDGHRSVPRLKRRQERLLENAKLSLRRVTGTQTFSIVSGRI